MKVLKYLIGRRIRFLFLIAVITCASYGAPPPDSTDVEGRDDRWLADESFYDLETAADEQPQADGRETVTAGLCPPVARVLPVRGCDLQTCSSDRECSARRFKCCYNGCVYTCLPEVKPPPYFDWLKEPMRRFQFGLSWLVPGPNSQVDVELCSTTPVDDDSDPLICPHGYECSIDDEGRPAEGIPNRGHCVKVAKDASESILSGSNVQDHENSNAAGSEVKDSASLHACKLEDQRMVLSGHSFLLQGRSCLCLDTKITCRDKPGSSYQLDKTT